MGQLLMIDDDADLCGMLQTYLTDNGLRLSVQHDSVSGLRAAIEGAYDLVIIDVMLPVFDGFTLLRKLRASSRVGVIMLTARSNHHDRIQGFDAGADDYVTKPFSPRELLSRIHAVLRRSTSRIGNVGASDMRVMSADQLKLNPSKREVLYMEQAWHLTEAEFLLLKAFLESGGAVISREDLVERVFQREFHPLDRSLDMHVSRLRRKLVTMGYPSNQIKTIRSSGYQFSSLSENE